MRRNAIALIAFVLLFAAASFAQDAMLTKEETVNYINKKLQEVKGRENVESEDGAVVRTKWLNLALELKGGNAVMTVTTQGGDDLPVTEIMTFNPAYIDSIKTKNDPKRTIEYVGLFFGNKKLVQVNSIFSPGGKERLSEETFVLVPFFATAPGNKEKIVKAFTHLRDLAKAEEDPFGN